MSEHEHPSHGHGEHGHDDHDDGDHIHPEPTSFLRKYVFSTDHKVIAKQFLWLGLLWLAWGGSMAMLIRWQLGYPGQAPPVVGHMLWPTNHGVMPAYSYSAFFTMHGTIMIFFAITPIIIGAFGNFCIPLMIGARDMIFPKLNMYSLWTFVLASIIMMAGFFVPGGAAATGWTAYPPLSTNVGQPELGMTLWALGIFVSGAATIMGAINYITTVIRLRAPGMGYFKMPLTVWGLWLTSILNALFVPVLGAAGILLVFDRLFGTTFFVQGMAVTRGGGDPMLFQHLFWVFGHPEVYILILPAWGIMGDIISFFSRRPAYGYKATVLSMTAITVLSMIVYGHHMYATGISPLLAQGFMTFTMLISIPSAILFLNWLGTMWKGSLHFTPPMLFALGVVFVFGLGGLTGMYLGNITTDIYLHDSYFVVGHFHFTMAAAVFLGSFAGIYFWFPKMFGKMMLSWLGKVHFFATILPLTYVFGVMHLVGYGGMSRRLYDLSRYEFVQHLQPLQTTISIAALTLGAAQFLFVFNFFYSLVRGRRAAANPWQVGTLEWTIPSPPPHHNFDVIPTVYRGPHEFSRPDVEDRDWLGQDEPDPEDHHGAPSGAEPVAAE